MIERYDGKMIQVRDKWGHTFTGVADALSEEEVFLANGEKDEGIRINGFLLYAGGIEKIEECPDLSIIRATDTWQQAGAYYVRIQAMAKKHHITLRQEFDEHDGPGTKYIVVTDHDFPIATARMYPVDDERVMIGRVVVLPEYRHRGIGTMVVSECEDWAEELGYSRTVLESRDNKIEFYEQMGYEVCGEMVDGDTFRCIRMEKELHHPSRVADSATKKRRG